MKVEIGKTYLTAEGRKAKVTHGNTQGILVAEVEGKSQSLGFSEDGKFLGDKTHHGNCDLIEEYKDETQPTPIAVREWGNISFDGKEETLDTSFSIMPHDMKIIGGYRIENVGSTPIFIASEHGWSTKEAPSPSSPVQSRKTIVEGEYGNLSIYYKHDQPKTLDNLRIEVTTSKHTAQEIREMIRVLGEVADYLEEQK